MSQVRIISAGAFSQEVLQSPDPVLVDFYADWCPPCRALAPMLERVAAAYAGRVRVVKVNVDQAPALAQRYQIRGIPALVFFHNGREVDRIEGLPDPRSLVARLDRLSSPVTA